MDTYEVKKTPIKGVWELGKLDSKRVRISAREMHSCIADNRLRLLSEFLRLNVDDSSWLNPQLRDVGRNEPNWHVDNHKPNNLCKPRCLASGSGNMIIMIKGKEGTLFKKSNGTAWKSKPWTIYFVNYNVVHASPLVENPRILSRFYLEGKKRRKIHPEV